jgi:hypothetical protein
MKRRFLHGEDSILNKTQGGGSGGMCLGEKELDVSVLVIQSINQSYFVLFNQSIIFCIVTLNNKTLLDSIAFGLVNRAT